MFNTEYLSHDQDEYGVTVHPARPAERPRIHLRSRYLVGADGARSQVVDELGPADRGRHGPRRHHLHPASAPISPATWRTGRHPALDHDPGASFGEIGMGLLRAIRPWDDWIAGWGYDITDGDPDPTRDRVPAKIRELIGDPEQEIEIVSVAPWYMNQANVTRWSTGRVFCGGDAVHRHPPSSGLGSNTSIQDGHNLAWKLAYAVRAGPDPSCSPATTTNAGPSGPRSSPVPTGPAWTTARSTRPSRPPAPDDPIAAGLAKLRDPSPAGVEARAALIAALELKNAEFNAQGIELNQRYDSSAVIPDPDAAPRAVWSATRSSTCKPPPALAPSSRTPGSSTDDGRRVSTLDVTGRAGSPCSPGSPARPGSPRPQARLPYLALLSSAPRHRGPLPRVGPAREVRRRRRLARPPGRLRRLAPQRGRSGTTTQLSTCFSEPWPRCCTDRTPQAVLPIGHERARGQRKRHQIRRLPGGA